MIKTFKDFIHIVFGILFDVTSDIIYEIMYFVQINMRYFAALFYVVLPYVMYYIGNMVAICRGGLIVGGELLIPVFVLIVIYYLNSIANKLGKGNTIPIPHKRFTEVDDSGEVTVEYNRMQELLLYMADLEDYMQRKRLL